MQCSACHNEVDPQSAFCARCGAPTGAAAAASGTAAGAGAAPAGAAAYTSVPTYAAAPAPAVVTGAGLSENAASAIAYLTIIPAIVFLVLEPYNRIPLVRFHAFQSIGITVAAIVIQIVLAICQVALHFIPGIFLIFSMVQLVVSLGIFLAWILAIFKASQGQWFKLPVIGDFAMKQARA